MPDNCNFLRETFRELGRIRGERREYLDLVQHEEPKELSVNEQSVKSKFWHDEDAQKLLRSIVRLQRGHKDFNVEDAVDDLEEAENLKLSKTKINKLLTSFRTNALINKDRHDDDNWYSVTKANRNRLVLFMNPEFGDCPDGSIDDILEYSSSDDEGDTSLEPMSLSETNNESEPPLLTQDFSKSASLTPPNKKRDSSANRKNIVTPPAEVDLCMGSKECPIEFSDDESDISDNERKPESRKREATNNLTEPSNKRAKKNCSTHLKNCSSTTLPISSKNILEDIQRIAKFVNDDCTSEILYGDVVGQYDKEKKWWIQFDNGDSEDFDEKQLRDGLQLYAMHQPKDTLRVSTDARSQRCRGGNIPMVAIEDDFITGKCIVQPNLRRRIHYAREDETSATIAKIYGVDAKDIIAMNNERKEYRGLKQSWKFNLHSPILLPL